MSLNMLLPTLACLVLWSHVAAQSTVSITGSSLVVPCSGPLISTATNLQQQQGGVAGCSNATPLSGGLASLVDGLLGLWRFDTISMNAASSTNKAVINRTISIGEIGPAATITGNSNLAALVQGKFGKALNVQPAKRNWAQIFPGPWKSTAPTTGFAVSMWFSLTGDPATNSGHLLERQFDNIDLNLERGILSCVVRGTTGTISGPTASHRFRKGTWSHVACSYSPATSSVTLYVNGTLAGSTVYTFPGGLLQHGDDMPLGIGNRPGTSSNLGQYSGDSIMAAIDELAIWNRALDPAEVAAIYTSNAPIATRKPTGFTTKLLNKTDVVDADREFRAVTVTWLSSASSINASSSSAAPATAPATISISTDRGVTWCEVKNGVALTDTLHGGSQELCTFPAVSLMVKAVWRADATLGPLHIKLHTTFPAEPPAPIVPVGWNLEGVTYYSSAWTFVDLMQGSAGDSWPRTIRSGVDSPVLIEPSSSGLLSVPVLSTIHNPTPCLTGRKQDGYPLEITPADQPPAAGFWVTGRIIYSASSAHLPSGTYTLVAQGTGSLSFSSNVSPSSLTLPLPGGQASLRIDTSQDIITTITTSKRGDHVRGLKLLMPSFTQTSPSPFHPTFTSRMGPTRLLRFMDWGNTNGNRVARWAHRSTPNSISQTAVVRLNATIATATCYTPPADAFINENPAIKVTTTSPHGLTTGQMVSITGSPGSLRTTTGRTITFNIQDALIEVLGTHTFVASLRDWSFAAGEKLAACQVPLGSQAVGGAVTFLTSPGVAYELMVDLANERGADAWVCVPYLADDEYVRSMARLLRDRLRGKLYIEYGNEVWNGMFAASDYAARMARKLNLTTATPDDWQNRLRFYGTRAAQVFTIFRSEFAAVGAQGRLQRVLAVQVGTGRVELDALAAATAGTGGTPRGVAEVLAIAPYFNIDQAELFQRLGQQGSYEVDSILDGCRAHIMGVLRQGVHASAGIAAEAGLRLAAYEGGQHLGGGDWRCAGGCENVGRMQAAFQAANRAARIRGLYDNLLRMWAAEGGAEFMAFTYTGGFSKWGSWGALEEQDQEEATAPKYVALQAYMAAEAAVRAVS